MFSRLLISVITDSGLLGCYKNGRDIAAQWFEGMCHILLQWSRSSRTTWLLKKQAVQFLEPLAINNLTAHCNNPDALKAQHNCCGNSILCYNYCMYVSDKRMELLSSHVMRILFLTWIALTLCFGEIRTKDEDIGASLGLVGCFEENHDYRGLPYNVTNSVGSLTAQLCKEACLQQFFR